MHPVTILGVRTLHLIDATYELFRSYFGAPKRTAPNGMEVGATHGLIYQWQSGALNEAYSDIFGETVDLLNDLGTDSPGALRGDDACSTFGGSPPARLEVHTPETGSTEKVNTCSDPAVAVMVLSRTE